MPRGPKGDKRAAADEMALPDPGPFAGPSRQPQHAAAGPAVQGICGRNGACTVSESSAVICEIIRPSLFQYLKPDRPLTWPPLSCRGWRQATLLTVAYLVAIEGIVLRKSKVAAPRIFRENTKRETATDSHTLNRVAEVAGEFNARGSSPSRLYTKDAPMVRRIFDHLCKATFATLSKAKRTYRGHRQSVENDPSRK
jgi:hypothetical protein